MITHREDSIKALQEAEQEKEQLQQTLADLQARNGELENQVTDLQLALCDFYESVVV